MSVYNIIWADDELNDLLREGTPLDKTVSLTFDDDEFIIHKAYKATDVEELLLQNKAGFFDAVITDANYNESKTSILDNQDNSGLAYIIGLIQKKEKEPRFDLLYYLFTGRTETEAMGSFRGSERFCRQFVKGETWFSKSDISYRKLLKDYIKNDIDERQSPDCNLKVRYNRELKIAQNIMEECTGVYIQKLNEKVFSWIKDFSTDDKSKKYISNLAEMRKVIEEIFIDAVDNKFVPPIYNVSDRINVSGIANYLEQGYYYCKPSKDSVENINTKYHFYEMKGRKSDDNRVVPQSVAMMLTGAIKVLHMANHPVPPSISSFLSVFYSLMAFLDLYQQLKKQVKNVEQAYYTDDELSYGEMQTWKKYHLK